MVTSTLHRAENMPQFCSPSSPTDAARWHTRQASLLTCMGSAGKGYESCAETQGGTGSAQTLFGDWRVTCPSAHAYFNVKMSQCSSGLSKSNLFLTSCFVIHWSSSAPLHLAVPTEAHNLERNMGYTCGTGCDSDLAGWHKYRRRLCHTWSGIFCVK